MRADVENVIKKFGVRTFGNKKNIEQVSSKLFENEQVIYIAPTNAVITTVATRKVEKLPGVFAITTKRIIFLYKIMFNESVDVMPLSEIKTVNCSRSFSSNHIEINTLTKNYNFLVSYKKEIRDELQKIINMAVENYNNLQNNKTETVDFSTQLEKLFELKEKGVLTEEEFNKKKKEILDNI